MVTKRDTKERCTPYALFVAAMATLGGFLFGYHTAVISGALIFLAPAFHLSIAQEGIVVSMMLIGAILGALVSGELADRIGRKRAMAATAFFFVVGSALLGVADSYEVLLWGRFISGIGVGMVSLISPLYLAEISPAHYRGAFVSSYQLAITVGILIAFLVNYLFAPTQNWRWMFAIGMFPSLIQFFSLFFMPETPAWLFKHHFSERAKQVLQKLRKDKEWMKSVAEMKSSADPHRRGEWKALLHSKLFKVVMLGVVLSAFQQITGINTVIYYAPKIFQSAGFTSATAAIFATLGIGIINVIATLISVKLLDQAGRRRLLLIGIAGMALSLAFLALAFFSSWEKIDQIAVISLMAYVASFAIGLGPVTWVLISEIYPLKVRGKAMTIATFVNWVFNYLVSLTFLDLIASLGSSGTFALYAAISAIGFWFVLQFIPETKDKSLEEIEAEFT